MSTLDDLKRIVSYDIHKHEYGCIKIKLAEMLAARGITRNRLQTLTGVKYEVIDRYYKAINVERIDLDFFSKVCFVLDCQIEDLLEYQKPLSP